MNRITEVTFARHVAEKFRRKNPRELWFATCIGFCKELAFYIACHEAHDIEIDHDHLSVVYDDRITVTLRLECGEWVITGITVGRPLVSFSPIYIWKLIKHGAEYLPARFFAAWNAMREPAVLPA